METTRPRNNAVRIIILIVLGMIAFGGLGYIGYVIAQNAAKTPRPAPAVPAPAISSSDVPGSSGAAPTPYIWPATWTPPPEPTSGPTSEKLEKTDAADSPTPVFVGTFVPVKLNGSQTFSGSSSGMTPMLSLPPGTAVVTWSYSGSPDYKPSAQAKAAHDNQITYIRNVHKPLLDLCQKNIDQARENKDEEALAYWKKAYDDYAKVRDEQLAAENKRYQQYVTTLAASDQTLFSISATQPKPLGLQQIANRIGPGSGKINLPIHGGEGYYFTVTASGPWKITLTMTK